MNWKCQQCQCSFEVPHGTTVHFCPQCGAKSENQLQAQHLHEKNIKPETTNCPVCCTEIQPDDEKIVCPDCKMTYHKDCWNDNNGCATYGCHSAGCLNPPPFKVNVTVGNDSATHTAYSTPTPGAICPKCHTQLAAGTTFCWSCGNEFGMATAIAPDAPLAGAWTRWTARMLDLILESAVIGIIIATVWGIPDNISEGILNIIVAPFAFLIDSAVYAVCGNTLGKWLFDVKVVDQYGKVIPNKKYFHRNIRVYCGLALPIVSLFTFLTQYNRVSKGNPTTYDETLNLKSIRYNANGFKTLLGIILFISVLIILFRSHIARNLL